MISVFKKASPNTKIIAVEPEGAPSLSNSLSKGSNTTLDHIDKFVDGAAVKRIGDLPFAICKNGVDVDGIRFHMEANQMFFTPDLKTAQQFMEISGVGSGKIAKKCFCPFCTLKAEDCWKNTGDDANANREEHLARLKTPRFSWMGMDPKYLVYVPCGLHAKCR